MHYRSLGLIALILFLTQSAFAQPDFHGAKATKSTYQVVYQLNTDDEAKIKATLKNIQNALDDARLKGKLAVELVVHGGGVAALKKGSPFEQTLLDLQKQPAAPQPTFSTACNRSIPPKRPSKG